MILSYSVSYKSTAQVLIDTISGRTNGVWWTKNNIIPDLNSPVQDVVLVGGIPPTITNIKNYAPFTKGVFATVTWRSLTDSVSTETGQAVYNWSVLDSTLRSFSEDTLLIILMVWAGPDCPKWIFDKMDVPKVLFNNDAREYPYYFHKASAPRSPYYGNNDSVYKKEWYKMLDSVAEHVKAYSGNGWKVRLRKNIVIVQSAEGSTGDEGPYGGTKKNIDYLNLAYKVNRNDARWVNLRRKAWQHQDSLYDIPIPPNPNYAKQIHLLVNCDPDDLEDGGWMQTNLPHVWRKTNAVGHGYQFNDEKFKKQQFDSLVNIEAPYTSKLTRIRCRDEMDRYGDSWQSIAPRWYNLYQAASALHFGMDIWPNTASGLLDSANYKPGFDFFTTYAGYKTPQSSNGGFCVLRDGLDAADTIRFPTGTFGSGTEAKYDVNGQLRCMNITTAYATYGAKQDDTSHAQGDAIWNMNATGLNDVGWNIFPGNYERWLTQIIFTGADSVNNGQGYWRIGNKDSNWYGRFAKGFKRNATPKKDSMFFRIDDSLFRNTGSVNCTLHIVYYDSLVSVSPAQSFKVFYDSYTDNEKQVTPVFRTIGLNKWVHRYIPITDGYFKHRGRHGSDIMIANADANNEIFALVEIIKSQ